MKKPEIVNSRLDNVPEMEIRGDIGLYDAYNISSSIGNLSDSSGKPAKKLRLKINSFGGDVMNAFTIVSAMQTFMNAGGEIETINEGRADSAAGWIFSCGTRGMRKIMQFAGVMTHPPFFADGRRIQDLPIGSPDRKILQDTYEKLVDIFSSSTGRNKSTIRDLMEAEKDMNADEAIRNGFADTKIMVNNAPKLKNSLSKAEIVNITSGLDYEVINTFTNKNQRKMKDVAIMLNLNPEASEAAILEAVKAIKNRAETAEADILARGSSLEQAQTELVNVRKELDGLKSAEIVNYVDSLIEADGTKKESRESLINMAKSDFETFKKLQPVVNAGAQIDKGIKPEGNEGEPEGVQNAKTFMNMTHAERVKLQNSDSAKYNQLANDYDKNYSKIK